MVGPAVVGAVEEVDAAVGAGVGPATGRRAFGGKRNVEIERDIARPMSVSVQRSPMPVSNVWSSKRSGGE